MLTGRPDEPESEEDDRMEDEEHRVEPVLPRLAQTRMHELVLGDEETGEGGEPDIDPDRMRVRRSSEDQPGVASRDRQRVERMAEPLPAWQAAPPMEPAFIREHRQCLQHRRNEEQAEHFTAS